MHVVHIIAASLRPDLDASLVEATLGRARRLRTAPGARAVLVAHTDLAVIVATWLDGRAALEPFAASPPHMEFVMRGLAPSISSMWSAGVETTAPPPEADRVRALWAFAIRTADTAFEWQVRDVLASLAAVEGDPRAHLASGPTFEERDRYRAGGVVWIEEDGTEPFRDALAAVREQWGEMRPHVVESFAEVVA